MLKYSWFWSKNSGVSLFQYNEPKVCSILKNWEEKCRTFLGCRGHLTQYSACKIQVKCKNFSERWTLNLFPVEGYPGHFVSQVNLYRYVHKLIGSFVPVLKLQCVFSRKEKNPQWKYKYSVCFLKKTEFLVKWLNTAVCFPRRNWILRGIAQFSVCVVYFPRRNWILRGIAQFTVCVVYFPRRNWILSGIAHFTVCCVLSQKELNP